MRSKLKVAAAGIAIFLVLASLVLLSVYYAFQRTPKFYEQALQLNASRARQTSQEMVQQTTGLVEKVRRPGEWESVFTSEQINGWLAFDLVENHAESIPPEVSDPRVAIEPGVLKIACRYTGTSVESILSLEVELSLREENEIAVRLRRAWAGAVPLPMSRVLETFRDAAQQLEWPIEWRQLDGDPVALISVPKVREHRGRTVSVQLQFLELRDGEIYLSGKSDRLE